MSFSINDLSRTSSRINQMQTNKGIRNQVGTSSSKNLENNVGFPAHEINFPTYTTKGKMSMAEYNASLVTNTLNKLNSPQGGNKFTQAATQTYQLTKDVVGAYLDVIV